MSLASRVANLFSSGSTTQPTDRNEFGFVDDGLSEEKEIFADVKLGEEGFRLEIMAPKAVEEEARPPYLHVRWQAYVSKIMTLIYIVHDCWRNWWHYW